MTVITLTDEELSRAKAFSAAVEARVKGRNHTGIEASGRYEKGAKGELANARWFREAGIRCKHVLKATGLSEGADIEVALPRGVMPVDTKVRSLRDFAHMFPSEFARHDHRYYLVFWSDKGRDMHCRGWLKPGEFRELHQKFRDKYGPKVGVDWDQLHEPQELIEHVTALQKPLFGAGTDQKVYNVPVETQAPQEYAETVLVVERGWVTIHRYRADPVINRNTGITKAAPRGFTASSTKLRRFTGAMTSPMNPARTKCDKMSQIGVTSGEKPTVTVV